MAPGRRRSKPALPVLVAGWPAAFGSIADRGGGLLFGSDPAHGGIEKLRRDGLVAVGADDLKGHSWIVLSVIGSATKTEGGKQTPSGLLNNIKFIIA